MNALDESRSELQVAGGTPPHDVRQQIWSGKVLGAVFMIVGNAVWMTSAVKFLYAYFSVDRDPISNGFGRLVKFIVGYAYHYALSPIWDWAPDIYLTPLMSAENAKVMFFYSLALIGQVLWTRSKLLAARVRKVMEQIEEDGWRSHGKAASHGALVNIHLRPTDGLFDKFHALYLAPVIVIVIGKLLGIS